MDARSSDDMGEVIEVDSNIKFAEKRKQEVEVIDLETYVFRDDTNVVNTASNSNSYATANGMDIYSNFLINGNAALANKPVYNKNARLDIATTTTTTTTTQPRVLPEPKTKKAPVTPDEGVPDDVRKNYHVIEMEGAAVYDAMLTHTNVALNRNEFHVIQVLKADTFFSYKVYNRWGRVGEQGEIKLSGPHESCWTAVKEFEDTFFAKTKNRWSDRKNFVAYPKCYTWLEMDYKKTEQKATSLPREVRKTFGPRVEKFMSLIINFAVMTKQHMTEIGYDAKKLPLNNLSKSTIMKAYDVLTLIAEVMHESPRELLQELSGEFYTIIPHDFGVKKMRDFIIDSPTKLRAKVEMVEALGEIENASKILFNCSGQKEGDIMLSQYLLLGCALAPIESSTKEYEMIANYMKNTAGSTNPKIIEIFRVSKDGEDERFRKYDRVKNRMLLWHGSRLTNYLGILSQGLRIAPQNVPLSGASFGRGLYFADMFTKSASYSAKDSKEIGILLLCEVALGEMQEIPHANSSAHKLQPGKMSTKGLGQQAPSQLKVLEDGVIIPTGSTVKQPKGSLYYNEYVVYKEDQVKMRYIVQVEYYNTTGRR